MYLCILLALSLVIVLIQIWDCGKLYLQLDVPSLILLLLLFFSALFATKTVKKFIDGFYYVLREKMKTSKEHSIALLEYKECLEAVSFAMKVLLVSGSVISILNMYLLIGTKDMEALLISFQISLSGILYGLLGYFLLLPVSYGLKEKIMHYVPDEAEVEESLEERSEKVYFKLRGMGLTAREAEVGRLIVCRKMSNKEISDELFISESTVKRHVTHIFEKLEISGREEIAERVKNGEIGGDSNGTEKSNLTGAGDIKELFEEESTR